MRIKVKNGGGLFLKSTTLRPGGPAAPPGSEKIVGISKTPGIGEKIRGGAIRFFSNVREKYYTSGGGFKMFCNVRETSHDSPGDAFGVSGLRNIVDY